MNKLLVLGGLIEDEEVVKIGRRWMAETSYGLGDKSYSVIAEMDGMIGGLGERGGDLHKILPGPIRWLKSNFSELDLDFWGGAEGLFYVCVENALEDKEEYFRNNYGRLDSGIPKFLPDFLLEEALPFAKNCFLMAIEDSGGSEAHRAWMALDPERMLGAKDMWGILDADQEFFLKFFKNLFHEFHHNIINPGVWKRFEELGPANSGGAYNLLDVLDEAIALFAGAYEKDKKVPYQKLEDDFLVGLAKDIMDQIYLFLGSSKRDELIDNFDEIISWLESSGGSHVDSDKKISFLKAALYDFRNRIDRPESYRMFYLPMKEALKSEWDRSGIDFVVDSDEDILIAFSRVLDENIDDLKLSFIRAIEKWGKDLSLEILRYMQLILREEGFVWR